MFMYMRGRAGFYVTNSLNLSISTDDTGTHIKLVSSAGKLFVIKSRGCILRLMTMNFIIGFSRH